MSTRGNPPPSNRRPATAAAVGAGAVIVVLILIVIGRAVLSNHDTPARSKPVAPSPTAAATPAPTTPAAAAGCNLPPGDQAIPTQGPPAEWVLVAGFAAPRSSDFGPGRRDGEIGSCFAHSPTGALFAISNFVADTGAAGRSPDALKDRFFDDGNKAGAARAIDRNGVSDNRGSEIAGFRFSDYTSARSTLEFLIQVTEGPHSGDYAALNVTVAWEDGDWHIVAPPGGRYSGTALTSASGYTRWSA